MVVPRSQVEDHMVEFVFCFFLYVVHVGSSEGELLPAEKVPQTVTVPLDDKARILIYLAKRENPAITGGRHMGRLSRDVPLFDSTSKELGKR